MFIVIAVILGSPIQRLPGGKLSQVAQNDDIIMMREVAHKERTHARKMRAFFRYADHSKDHATWINKPVANGMFLSMSRFLKEYIEDMNNFK